MDGAASAAPIQNIHSCPTALNPGSQGQSPRCPGGDDGGALRRTAFELGGRLVSERRVQAFFYRPAPGIHQCWKEPLENRSIRSGTPSPNAEEIEGGSFGLAGLKMICALSGAAALRARRDTTRRMTVTPHATCSQHGEGGDVPGSAKDSGANQRTARKTGICGPPRGTLQMRDAVRGCIMSGGIAGVNQGAEFIWTSSRFIWNCSGLA